MNNDLSAFYIPKAKGYRKITTYKDRNGDLIKYHDKVNISLQKRLKQSIFAKAYIKKRSIVTNAKTHMYNDIFISMDIKDFFQSITHDRLINTLYYEINKNSIGHFTLEQCRDLVKSCSTGQRGIAIGLKPSPILANIYLKDFDGVLYGWLKKLDLDNVIYTRYADDMMVSYRSNSKDTVSVNKEIISKVSELLELSYLRLNASKTRIINLNISNHVRITGINIIKNDDNFRMLTVGRKQKDDLYYRSIGLLIKETKDDKWYLEAKKIQGMQSFILSVEGERYLNTYSKKMNIVINDLGFKNLKDLIDNLI